MHTPHDALFAATFGHPHHAAGWLACVLPAALAAAIDWPTMRPIRERFPGARLRPHFADAGFAARILTDGGPHTVLLLLEHKSYGDPTVRVQLLRYSIHVRRALQQAPGEAPFVLPVLLRHGAPRNDGDDIPQHGERTDPVLAELHAAQPRQTVYLDDLDAVDEAQIAARAQSPLATLTQLCLKVLRRTPPAQVPRFFDRWQDLLRAVDRADVPPHAPPPGPDAVDAIGWYALAVTDVDSLVLAEVFSRILQRNDITIMSTLERTFQKGRAEGKAETLLLLLSRRFGPLDAAVADRVRGASLDELDRWTGRVLDAATLDALFDGEARRRDAGPGR